MTTLLTLSAIASGSTLIAPLVGLRGPVSAIAVSLVTVGAWVFS